MRGVEELLKTYPQPITYLSCQVNVALEIQLFITASMMVAQINHIAHFDLLKMPL